MNSTSYHIPSFEELRKMRKPIRNINLEHRGKLSTIQKTAVWITEHVGTMGFFVIILFWTVGWLFWNVFGPLGMQFDPFPGFVLWLFISNMIQLLLLPLIMIGQNIQGRHAEARAEADFEVNSKAERELEVIIMHLEKQEKIFSKIVKNFDELEKSQEKKENP